jgi:hypothetical protein
VTKVSVGSLKCGSNGAQLEVLEGSRILQVSFTCIQLCFVGGAFSFL